MTQISIFPIRKSLDERNSRLSVAQAKNRAEENNLSAELNYLKKQKTTALRILQNEKHSFKLKYSNGSGNVYGRSNTDEMLRKYFIPSSSDATSGGDSSDTKPSKIDSDEIHNMLFTDDEIDIEKILCLHLISAHRTESLTPPKRKGAFICKIHSPLERLLERSRRKHIHLEQKMTSMLPIYTIETLEFGTKNDQPKDLINDGRLATRLLLNEIIRELINTVLNALRQTNPEKSFEIFEMANDTGCLKSLFVKKKIVNFLDVLMNSPLINSCESFILTAPFRVKSIQLELRTLSGSLESLVRQLRQNVLQLPARTEMKIIAEETIKKTDKKILEMDNKASKKSSNQEKNKGKHKEAGIDNKKNSNIARKPNKYDPENTLQLDRSIINNQSIQNSLEINEIPNEKSNNSAIIRKPSSSENVKVHLKQTTCPACMIRYKIPLPTPKTPRIKLPPIMPLAPGEDPNLRTNTERRISMLINKELFQLQSYDKRFSSEESIRRKTSCLLSKVVESCSSCCLNLSTLELAKIELEIKQKETQKKLEKFLSN